MHKQFRLGKIALVIFLTVLIWVWADLRQDDTHAVSKARIYAARLPNVWVRFSEGDYAPIDEIVFKGPLSNINRLKQKESAGIFEPRFLYNPEKEGATTSGELQINVAKFIENLDEVKELGVAVESCIPETITVRVVSLVLKSCRIECLDADGNPLGATIDPPQVQMYVPPDWGPNQLIARVQLSGTEAVQARSQDVPKKPSIVLRDGQTRTAADEVLVRLPPESENMKLYPAVPAVLYISYSQNINGKYKAEVRNQTELSKINIRASQAAYTAYRDQVMPPQITLYILESDVGRAGILERAVEYNFPQEYVRSGQIELEGPPAKAQFTLSPIVSEPQQ